MERGVKTIVTIMTAANIAEPVTVLALRLWSSREPNE